MCLQFAYDVFCSLDKTMRVAKRISIIAFCAVLAFIFISGMWAQNSETPFHQPFQEGCCLNNHDFPRPQHVSQLQLSSTRLREALNCATNNGLVGGTRYLANALGDNRALHVAYYYGKYMPEQHGPALTIAVYSTDGNHGVLFDMDWESRKYFVENLPDLLRATRQWRVSEINGGLWSYTRLWYLAQEIGSRPRVSVPVDEIDRSKPVACTVFFDDATKWKPDSDQTKPAR